MSENRYNCDVNGRPIRTNRGVPPARYGLPQPVQPVIRQQSQPNLRSNASVRSTSSQSSVYDLLTGRSNTIPVPVTVHQNANSTTSHYNDANSNNGRQSNSFNHVNDMVSFQNPQHAHLVPYSHSVPTSVMNPVYRNTVPATHVVYTRGQPYGTGQVNQTFNQIPRVEPIPSVPMSSQPGPLPMSNNFDGNHMINTGSIGSHHSNQRSHEATVYESFPSNNDDEIYEYENPSMYLSRPDSIKSVNSFTKQWVNDLNANIPNNVPDFEKVSHEIHPNTNVQQIQQSNQRDIVLSEAFKALNTRNIKDLPTFGGDIKEWPIFYNEFCRTTEEFKISNNENLRRLNKALERNARKAVLPLLTSSENVDVIMKILQNNFGQPQWVISILISEMKMFPALKDENPEQFRDFYNTVLGTVTTIKNMKEHSYLQNADLLSCLVEKLPVLSRSIWGHYKANNRRNGVEVNLEHFCLWLEEELEAQFANFTPNASAISTNQRKSNHHSSYDRHKGHYHKKETVMNHNHVSKRAEKCKFCDSTEHQNHKCDKFAKLSVKERRQKVKDLNLCFICIGSSHGTQNCRMRFKCKTCGAKHNNLLHMDLNENSDDKQKKETVLFNTKSFPNTLLRCGKVKLQGPKGTIEIFALFDDGSTSSQIENNLADELGIDGPVSPITYQWTREICAHDDDSRVLQMKISGVNSNKIYDLKNVRTVSNLALPVVNFDMDKIISLYPMIDVEKLMILKNAKPRMLIGSNNSGLISPLKTYSYSLYGLQLCHCRLGWTIHGDIDPNLPSDKEFCFHVTELEKSAEDIDLSQLIKQSYEVDDFGIKIQSEKLSDEDSRATAIMKRTLKRTGDRFEIGHLYKYEDFEFPESKTMALKRLYFIERKMDRDEKFADMYCEKIQDYVQKGYARKLDPDEVNETAKTWYLPHFGVTNPNKPGKFRLVMDAKAKSNGYSLNDLLLKGPDFVPSILSVIWRGRLKRIGILSDIQEMFHQILIRKEDRDSQRFLFRGKDRNRDPDVYEMISVIFGAVSSPSIAQFVKNENAREIEEETPGAFRAITKQHYVDDYFDSADDEETAIDLISKVIEAHKKGGFKLVKFITNSEKVTNAIPEELRAETDKNKIGERVLGIIWDINQDLFVFPLTFDKHDPNLISGSIIPTKRQLLKFMMSIFDPIGFLSPIIIQVKILFQELWRSNMKWDDTISEDIHNKWCLWLTMTKELEVIKVSRCYFPKAGPFRTAEIHVFCDASDKAYATVVYLRIIHNEQVFVSLVSSKARVAPVKSMTIPRLELQGCVTGALLADTIKSELDIQISRTFYWSDSKVVISWLQSKDKLNMFVGSRVTSILERSKVSEWCWLKSEFNVADLATKEHEITHELMELWLNGPKFLFLPESDWPIEREFTLNETETINFHTAIEERIEFINFHFEDDEIVLPDINRFSNFHRLIRSTAYYLRMCEILQMKKSEKPRELKLSMENICKAKSLWYQRAQMDEFKQEYYDLKKNGYVRTTSKLYSYSPFLHDGVIRMQGRMPNQLSFEENNPVILPYKHPLTELLIKTYHEANLHVGLETVVNNLRKKFRILKIRAAVKRIFFNCNKCKIKKVKTKNTKMAPLPTQRTDANVFPFTNVGVDYFGPILVKHGRKLEKFWGVLFTCLSIRAVHIELASSLSSSSCIMAIKRFINLRGVPKVMISDNGTCFIGANNELRKFMRENFSAIQDELSIYNIQWKFISPGAPHQGGAWERLIRSVKVALKITLNEQHPTYEVLSTSLTEISNTLNNRPLTHISDDPHEQCALTPNDLLLGRVNLSQFDFLFDENDIHAKNIWKHSQTLADRFWKRWIKEYRPEILKRTNWFDDRNEINFKVGDVVMIIDEQMNRGRWPKGIIKEIFMNKTDGKIRNVKVETNNGEYVRATSKVAYLFTP